MQPNTKNAKKYFSINSATQKLVLNPETYDWKSAPHNVDPRCKSINLHLVRIFIRSNCKSFLLNTTTQYPYIYAMEKLVVALSQDISYPVALHSTIVGLLGPCSVKGSKLRI